MFKIEITFYINNKQSGEIIEMNGDILLPLKDELANTLLSNISDSGYYHIEMIITEDCEYYDSDELDVYVDVENQVVT